MSLVNGIAVGLAANSVYISNLETMQRLDLNSGAHNTIFGPDGRAVYLGGLRTNSLGVVDPATHRVIRQIGPLGGPVRPFTINGAQTLAYINVNGLLGFEIATSGRVSSSIAST
jgi:YVTN family beta-propeller protein